MRNLKYLPFILAFTLANAHTLPGAGENQPQAMQTDTKYGKLYYEVEGSGPAVVLIAGGPGSSHLSFHPSFSKLASKFKVVYLDNAGRGKSDPLPKGVKHSVQRDAEDIESIRKALGLETISVVGHSYGAMPALEYAINHPNRVTKMVLCGSPGSHSLWQQGSDNVDRHYAAYYPELWGAYEMARADTSADAGKAIDSAKAKFPDLSWRDKTTASQRLKSSDPRDQPNEDVFKEITGTGKKLDGTIAGYEPLALAKSVKAKTLVCNGRHDHLVQPQVAQKIKESLPAALSTLTFFEKSGHRPWAEEEALYISTLIDFIQSN